jgi:cytochrome c-type biogenesis protein CcmH/NrfF
MLDDVLPRLAYQNHNVTINVHRLAEPSTKAKDPGLQSRSQQIAQQIKAKVGQGDEVGKSSAALAELVIDFRE